MRAPGNGGQPQPGYYGEFLLPHHPRNHGGPVVTIADGHSYERSAIEKWFARSHQTSPLTGMPLTNLTIIENISLRNAIDEWRVSMTSSGKSSADRAPISIQAALDEVESRMKQTNIDGTDEDATEEQMESIAYWLNTHTMLAPEVIQHYVKLLEQEWRATTMAHLHAAAYTRQDFIDVGVRVPHVGIIQCAIHRYSQRAIDSRSQDTNASSTVIKTFTPDSDKANTLVKAIKVITLMNLMGAPSSEHHYPLVRALAECGVETGCASAIDLFIGTIRVIRGAPSVTAALFEGIGQMVNDEAMRNQILASDACSVIVDQTRSHMSDQEVSEEACGVIRNLSVGDDVARKLTDCGVCQVLVDVTKLHPLHQPTQHHALSAIVNIGATDPVLRRAIFDAGATSVILAAMKNFPEDAKILLQGIMAICVLAVNDELANQLSSQGICEAMVAVIRASDNSPEVLVQAYKAMINMSVNHEHIKVKFGTLGTCEAIAGNMRAQPHNEKIQVVALKAMGCIAFLTVSNRKYLRDAIGAVVTSLKNFRSVELIVQHALALLWMMTTDKQGAMEMAKHGTYDVLASAMRLQEHVVEIQTHTCTIVVNLALNDTENHQELFAVGIIDLIAGALMRHAQDEDLQVCAWKAVGALLAIMPSPDTRRRFGVLCGSLTMALRTFTTTEKIVVTALKVLGMLSIEDKHRTQFGKDGACEALVQIMRSHADNEEVLIACYEATTNLTTGVKSENSRRLMSAGACEAMVVALRKFNTNEELCTTWFWAARHMMSERVTAQAFFTCGICDLMAGSLRTLGRNNASIAAQTLAAAVNLTVLSAESRVKLGDLGVAADVMNVMKEFATHKAIQHQGIWLIGTVCATDENKVRFSAARDVVKHALQTFPEDMDIQLKGLAALQQLS